MKTSYKYNLKLSFTLGYLTLIIIGLMLIIGRWYSSFNNDFVIISHEINSHISNFSLSMILYLFIGNLWLSLGVELRPIIFLGIVLITSNFIYETFIVFLNTTDIIDALYGLIGVLVAFVFLFFTNKYGLTSNN